MSEVYNLSCAHISAKMFVKTTYTFKGEAFCFKAALEIFFRRVRVVDNFI